MELKNAAGEQPPGINLNDPEGARKLLAGALEIETDLFLAQCKQIRDENGKMRESVTDTYRSKRPGQGLVR
jgi:hypothetical protein